MYYKTVASIEGVSPKPIGRVGIKIDLCLNRELTDVEASRLSEMARDVLAFINRNTIANDPEEIKKLTIEKTSLLNCFPYPTLIYAKEIPNGYYAYSANPWFLVTTPKGVIKIGWRKRVIEIDWSESDIKYNGNELFKLEDVTKGCDMIHAWGYDKAKEYIGKLLS